MSKIQQYLIEREKEFDEQKLGELDFCGNEDHECDCMVKEEQIKTFHLQTIQGVLQKVVEMIEGKMELHRHNSIPSYTEDLNEGCITCKKNKILSDMAEEIKSVTKLTMWCFKDKIFCGSKNCNNDCGRKITEEEKKEARELNIPIAYGSFCEEINKTK